MLIWLALATIAIATWSFVLGRRRKLPSWARWIGPAAMLATGVGAAYTLWSLHRAFGSVGSDEGGNKATDLAVALSRAMYGVAVPLAIDVVAAAMLLYFSIRSPRR